MHSLQQKNKGLRLVQSYVACLRSAQRQNKAQILFNGMPGQMVAAHKTGGLSRD